MTKQCTFSAACLAAEPLLLRSPHKFSSPRSPSELGTRALRYRLATRQFPHHPKQFLLGLKPNPRNLRAFHIGVFYRDSVPKSTERLKNPRIRFVAAQPKPGRDFQRQLVPAMRNAA